MKTFELTIDNLERTFRLYAETEIRSGRHLELDSAERFLSRVRLGCMRYMGELMTTKIKTLNDCVLLKLSQIALEETMKAL